jgi:hypothetical protein
MTQPEYYSLCALKGAIKLEIKGMHRRGRSACAIAADKFGLKGKTRKEILKHIEGVIDDAQRNGASCRDTDIS